MLARQLLDIGIRDEDFQRDTFRVVGGARGTFNEDWTYEISANYGKFKEDTTTSGYVDRQRFMLSLDAGLNPLTGADPVPCRSSIRLPRPPFPNNAANAARLAADIAACVPYNPFGGAGQQRRSRLFQLQRASQGIAPPARLPGLRLGRFEPVFELPGGPVRFALGARISP